MTTLDRQEPPPPDKWTLCSPQGHPLCCVCENFLTATYYKDPQLGRCCMECAPFVISADRLLNAQ